MRSILIFPLVLPTVCGVAAEPGVRLATGGLALDSRAGRAELRMRVALAAQEFCRGHEEEVTPQLMRRHRSYCLRQVRASLTAEMPAKVLRAYRRALHEAGLGASDVDGSGIGTAAGRALVNG